VSGKLIIICAPSGAGKTTIVRHIIENVPGIEFSVSATNRTKRHNELDGVDYYFIQTADFQQKIRNDEFLEWEEVYPGTYYGTLKDEINRIWNRGNHVIFDVDVEGGLSIKRHFGKRAMLVFVQPPSLEVLKQRLLNRDTETAKSFETRVAKAEREMEYAKYADRILINDRLEQSLPDAKRIAEEFINADD
jgi:guanylate kinase